MEIRALLLVFAWVGIAAYADVKFKAAKQLWSVEFITGALAYLSTSIVAFWSFRLKQWGWITIVWSCVALALGLLLSVVIFSEPFTMRRRIASVLVIAAILLAE